MNFIKKDFDKLPFDIESGVDYLTQYPQLKKTPEFSAQSRNELPLPFDDVFRYIILLYSSTSPLLQITDQGERKRTAAMLCNIDLDLLLNNKSVNRILIGFLRIQKDTKFSKLIVFYEAYYNQSQKLLNDDTVSGERTEKIIANIESLEHKIEATIAEITAGDDSLGLKKDIIQTLEDLRPSEELRPEAVAKKLAAGEKPLGDYTPYR